MASHPPPPGPFVQPDVSAIEDALRDITFPISKREMMEQLTDEDTVVMEGRNVELRTLVKDIYDDYFDSAEEFHEALETTYADRVAGGVEAMLLPLPPTGFPEEMRPHAPGRSDQPAVPDDNA